MSGKKSYGFFLFLQHFVRKRSKPIFETVHGGNKRQHLALIDVCHREAQVSRCDLQFALALAVELNRRDAGKRCLAGFVFIVSGEPFNEPDLAVRACNKIVQEIVDVSCDQFYLGRRFVRLEHFHRENVVKLCKYL